MKNWAIPLILSSTLAATGCHKKEEAMSPDAANVAQSQAAAAAANAVEANAAAAGTTPDGTPLTHFNMSAVAVSTAPLGAFPYLSLPAGYKPEGEETLDVAQFPVWVGDHFNLVEGKVYQSRIGTDLHKSFSKFEIERNIDHLIQQAGGVKVVDAKIPSDATGKLDEDVKLAMNTGLGDIYNNKVATYLIHRVDKDIWVHFTANTVDGSWAIVETQPFVPTARLVPPAGAPAPAPTPQ